MVLSGMNSMEQLEDNIHTMKDFQPMKEEEFRLCAEAARLIQSSLTIPCTGCGYCIWYNVPNIFLFRSTLHCFSTAI